MSKNLEQDFWPKEPKPSMVAWFPYFYVICVIQIVILFGIQPDIFIRTLSIHNKQEPKIGHFRNINIHHDSEAEKTKTIETYCIHFPLSLSSKTLFQAELGAYNFNIFTNQAIFRLKGLNKILLARVAIQISHARLEISWKGLII